MIVTPTYLANLTEQDLFSLFQKRYADIIDLNVDNEFAPLDWYIPSLDTYIEAKCRKKDYPTIFVEKDKWDQMKQVERCWYVNSTPRGIYAFVLQEIEEPLFRERLMEKSQQFNGQGEYILKTVGELVLRDCKMQLDHLLFQ